MVEQAVVIEPFEIESSSGVTVEEIPPSLLTAERIKQLKIFDLIAHVQRMNPVSDREAISQKLKDTVLLDTDDFFTTFIAMRNGEAVGVMSLNKITEHQEDFMGSRFWDTLKEVNPDLYRQSVPRAYNIWHIAVDPEERGRGISRALTNEFVDIYNPAIVVGQTVSSVAAQARVLAYGQRGYSTQVGNQLVSSEGGQRSFFHEAAAQAYFKARGIQINDQRMFVIDESLSPQQKEDPRRIHPLINEVFTSVRRAQQEIGNDKTAVVPVISIASF